MQSDHRHALGFSKYHLEALSKSLLQDSTVQSSTNVMHVQHKSEIFNHEALQGTLWDRLWENLRVESIKAGSAIAPSP